MKRILIIFCLAAIIRTSAADAAGISSRVLAPDGFDQIGASWVVSGSGYLPAPEGTEDLGFPNGNFSSSVAGWPSGGWMVPDEEQFARTFSDLSLRLKRQPSRTEMADEMKITIGEYDYIRNTLGSRWSLSPWKEPLPRAEPPRLVSGRGGPLGLPYLRLAGGEGNLLRSPRFRIQKDKPHMLSMWVRSNVAPSGPWAWFDVGLYYHAIGFYGVPNTGGQWRRVGVYFRPTFNGLTNEPQNTGIFTLYAGKDPSKYVEIADIRLRTATEEEYSSAYRTWRRTAPSNDRPASDYDGKYLALTAAKLQGRLGLPGKPFLIYGLGSSWTGYQGDLEEWRQAINERYPAAPPITYKMMITSGCPYDYLRYWVRNDVTASQPDLVFIYTNGTLEGLEDALRDVRRYTTADIIVPSLHAHYNHTTAQMRQGVDKGTCVVSGLNFEKMRLLCEKYNAQFVHSAAELVAWLERNGKQPIDLLGDSVHQNALGRTLINENISRHLVVNPKPAYDPDKVESRVSLASLLGNGTMLQKEAAAFFKGDWKVDGQAVMAGPGARLNMNFTGNRIDLIAYRAEGGGSLNVLVDGQPADKLPVFFVGFVLPNKNNSSDHQNAYNSPHCVELGTGVVPQEWTMRMLDDEGNFEVSGSVTKADGQGNWKERFVSKSGQIIIDPSVWRARASKKGDTWTFRVSRPTTGKVSLDGTPGLFTIPLAQNLTNKSHELELVVEGKGAVKLDSLYVFRPML